MTLLVPLPIELDPRPCQLCGLTIDRHNMVDADEGPEFLCPWPDEMTLDELERRAELEREIEIAAMVREMELNDPRDRWKHTGEPAPSHAVRNGPFEPWPYRAPEPYRTLQVTIDAFWYVVALKNPEKLSAWLRDHPRDTSFLLKLLEAK
jgi:hypothetical protein